MRGFGADDEQRIHQRLEQDIDDRFGAHLTSVQFEARLGGTWVTVVACAVSSALLVLELLRPGNAAITAIAIGTIGLVAAACLVGVRVAVRSWLDTAVAEARAAQLQEQQRYAAALERMAKR